MPVSFSQKLRLPHKYANWKAKENEKKREEEKSVKWIYLFIENNIDSIFFFFFYTLHDISHK